MRILLPPRWQKNVVKQPPTNINFLHYIVTARLNVPLSLSRETFLRHWQKIPEGVPSQNIRLFIRMSTTNPEGQYYTDPSRVMQLRPLVSSM